MSADFNCHDSQSTSRWSLEALHCKAEVQLCHRSTPSLWWCYVSLLLHLCKYTVPQVSFFFFRLLGGTDIFADGSVFFFRKRFRKIGQFRKKCRVCVSGGLSLDGESLGNEAVARNVLYRCVLFKSAADAVRRHDVHGTRTRLVSVRARERDGWDALREATGIMDVMTQRPDSSEPRNAHRDGWRHVRTLGQLSLPSTPHAPRLFLSSPISSYNLLFGQPAFNLWPDVISEVNILSLL